MESTSRETLTLLALTPFTTTAPLLELKLEDGLPAGDVFRGFASHLDQYTRGLHSTKWGEVDAVQLLRGKLHQNFEAMYRNVDKRQKILVAITHRIAEFVAAFRFYDVLVRLHGGDRASFAVLKQPRGDGYVGDKPYMDAIQDLSTLITQFKQAADAYSQLLSTRPVGDSKNPEPLHDIASCASDPLLQIASELSLSAQVKKAMKVIRNLSAVAFTVRLLIKADCISVPSTYKALVDLLPPESLPRTKEEADALSLVMKTTRGLRQAFELATLVSPLVAIYPGREIQKDPICSEELLLNCKLLGNCKTQAIQQLEDQVWAEILRIANGEQSAFEAVIRLRDAWNKSPPALSKTENVFFSRSTVKEYRREMSVFTTVALEPYPPAWPLTDACHFIVSNPTPASQSPTNAHLVPAPSLSTGMVGSISPGTSEMQDIQPFAISSLHLHDRDPGMDVGPHVSSLDGEPASPAASADGEGGGSVEGVRGVSPPPSPEDRDSNMDLGSHLTTPDPEAAMEGLPPGSTHEVVGAGSAGQVGDSVGGRQEPRKSSRERNPPPPRDPPPRNPKGRKTPRKRAHDPQPGAPGAPGASRAGPPALVSTMKARQVHMKGLPQQRQIIAQSAIKMEAVEPAFFNPDVSETTPPLVINVPVTRYSDSHRYAFNAWDAGGNMHTEELVCHNETEFRQISALFDAIKAQHCPSGRPRWLDDPANAVLRVFGSPSQYIGLGPAGIQATFAKQQLVIHQWSQERLDFNLDGLERAGDLHHETSIQDFTVHIPPQGDGSARVRAGSLAQVFASSTAPPGWQKSLNALHFPQSTEQIDPHDPMAVSSDVRAYFRTKSDLHCAKQMNAGDVRWRIVGTTGAFHGFHVDPHGDGTFVLVRVGKKAWVLAIPKDEAALLDLDLWTAKEVDVMRLDYDKWKVEMILLTPGDLLIQWPHASHFVYTPQDAICFGGHFNSTATLRRTIIGIIHTFFVTNITNIDHPTFPTRINSLVCFYLKGLTADPKSIAPADGAHLPDVESSSGLMDVVLLACLVELQNALCPLSYECSTDSAILALLHQRGLQPHLALADFDISEMSHELRLQCIYSRGRMVYLLRDFLFRKYRLRDRNGQIMDPWCQIFIPTLAHLITALKTYSTGVFEDGYAGSGKRKAKGKKSPQSFTRQLVNVQLKSSSRRWDELDAAVKACKVRPTTLLPPDIAFTVEKLDMNIATADPNDARYRQLGMRTLDSVYIEQYAALVQATAAASNEGVGADSSTDDEPRSKRQRR